VLCIPFHGYHVSGAIVFTLASQARAGHPAINVAANRAAIPDKDDGGSINSCGVEGLQGETQMNTSIRKFLAEEDGITALEYGILAALVAVILVAVIGKDGTTGLGKVLADLFQTVSDKVSAATT
jgi:pilus assembly protein Flp/PilA